MKNIITIFKKLQPVSVLIGMAFGAAIGLILFSYLVPSGTAMIGYYHSKIARMQASKNMHQMDMMRQSDGTISPNMGHMMSHTSNSYMMAKITTEKQFLTEMKQHHEAAVVMAKEVLLVPSLHSETKKLAEDIIRTQSNEINLMDSWLTAWK